MTVQSQQNEAGLRVSRSNGIATILISREAKMNAISQAMWRSMIDLVAELEADDTVRVLVLRGAGDNFCAGADVSEFDTVRRDAETARSYEMLNAGAFAAIRNTHLPTIAAISGVCFGGGFGLAAACDLRIASPDALFSVPAARLGLAYPVEAMGDIVATAGAQMARYLTFSGARIDAARARECGFLLEVVPSDVLISRATDLAATIARNAPLSIRASKVSISAALTCNTQEAERAQGLGDITFESADYAEGRRAFRERRPPHFAGH
ncbi:enoyl-CoA hydratase/isomerase family protein [Nitratireductor aquimarinus]|uniref:enoyl-CoA hydratase/isomerase family protein n=1 Tax=Alphaproteobacteria TaxID=28211 RepID=UPI0019D344F9|nr:MULTISPECIES: enoyl-CoA hydratase-related protein [Alphaproteobacteria]MBN7756196.1 enoyl-CoA hydratase/isomerase family protein [Nitratireductor aquimarinus]MBY5998954.1 enoyl-CoA hydratase/isomerase family protein [Tritonibacter mobilis]MBY6020982.1 enoyl-CoA hydratase/isomerase family protein [Nitratireductor sp. DP7N14-4]